MKIKLGLIRQNPVTLMRKLGYSPFCGRNSRQTSFVRRLTGGFYPRFHIYLNDSYIINLHLDAKKPSYSGQKAHSGEYDSKIVKQEATRIKKLLKAI